MNALTQTEQAEEYINRFALRELVEEWLSRASVECPEDPYQYLIDEAIDQRRSGGGIVTCPNSWCNMTMPASRFAEHQKTCNNAANWVRCVRCNTRVDAAKLSQHRLYCKLERCSFCGEMVLPRMLPMCPYKKVAKAERDRQAAMHRKERRLEKEAVSAVPALQMVGESGALRRTQSASPFSGALMPPPSSQSANASPKLVTAGAAATTAGGAASASPLSVPHSQSPLSSPRSSPFGGETAMATTTTTSGAASGEVKTILKPSAGATASTTHNAPSTSTAVVPRSATARKKSARAASSMMELDGESQPGSPNTVALGGGEDRQRRRGKSASGKSALGTRGDPGANSNNNNANKNSDNKNNNNNEPSVPRPSFPAFLAADMALREKLENYPDTLIPALSTIQTVWRRNMTLHLFREQVFSAVWRHMDSAQEGAGGLNKEGAAIRLAERNLRSDRRISSIDDAGQHGRGSKALSTAARTSSAAGAASAAAAAAAAADRKQNGGDGDGAEGAAGELSSSHLRGSLQDEDFCKDEEPIPSFESDPVHIAETPLSNGGYMRVRDFEALTRHCQAREVLQFSVVLKLVRAATKLLRQRPLVQHIAIPASSSLVVVGDLHGQMKDLEYIINYMGLPSAERFYLFNGDFIDRGPYGCEVLMFIYGLLCTYPDSVFVNRGNHENYSTNTEYGFMAELYAKYAGRASYLLDAMTDSYEVMSLMSIIDHRVAVVHGGAPRLVCKLAEIEAIGHVRDIPVEQQTTRAEQLLAELLWNDPVEKFRSRQLGMNHQGEGWRSSSRGCGVEYLANITDQFLKNNDLKLLIRSHDVKTAGFELVHKNRSITVFSASNYGGVSGNRGAVAVLTKEAVQPVFHTWFLKEDYREHQQDGLLDGGIDVFLQDDRSRNRVGGGGNGGLVGSPLASPSSPNRLALGGTRAGDAAKLDGTTGAMVVASHQNNTSSGGVSSPTSQNPPAFGGAVQSQQPKRVNAAMIAEAALMDGDEYICAYYLSSGGVLDDDDMMSDTSSRSSAFSDSEDRVSADTSGAATATANNTTNITTTVNAIGASGSVQDGAGRASLAHGRTPPTALGKVNSTSVSSSSAQRWPTGGGTGSMSSARLTGAGSRGTQISLASHSSFTSQGMLRIGCALAQDMSIVIQLQTLQQIREQIYFHRYALLVAFNQVDEMHTGTVYKAEWCVVMRDVLKLDIPWYYLCQFLAPRLVVDGVPSVEYMRFLRHFDVCFAIDFRLSWQKSTIQRISSGLDLPEDIINAFCERPAMNVSGTSNQNPYTATMSSCGETDRERFSPPLHARAAPEPSLTSPLTTTTLEFPAAVERLGSGQRMPHVLASLEKPWNFAASTAAATQGDPASAEAGDDHTTDGNNVHDGDDLDEEAEEDVEEEEEEEDEDWWCDVQLDFKTFAMKVRVLSPAAAAMEDNEIFALFCFFDVSLQGHVYVGDMVNSITAVMGEEGSVDEAELLVSGEIDFSAINGGGRSEGRSETRQPRSPSCSSSAASSSSALSAPSVTKAPAGSTGISAIAESSIGGNRSLLASKMKMTGGKSRLMRPPSSSSNESERPHSSRAASNHHSSNNNDINFKNGHEDGGGSAGGGDGANGRAFHTGRESEEDEDFQARTLSPTAPASIGDKCTRPYHFSPPIPSHDFFAKVGSDEFVKVGEEKVEITNSASRTAPGSLLGGRHPLHPSSSEETDTDSSVASTRPTISTRNSDAAELAATQARPTSHSPSPSQSHSHSQSQLHPLPQPPQALSSSSPPRRAQRGSSSSGSSGLAHPSHRHTDSFESGAAPPAFASTARAGNASFSAPSSPVWVLPLEYDDDETDPNDAGATVPPESLIRHTATLSASDNAKLAGSTPETAAGAGDIGEDKNTKAAPAGATGIITQRSSSNVSGKRGNSNHASDGAESTSTSGVDAKTNGGGSVSRSLVQSEFSTLDSTAGGGGGSSAAASKAATAAPTSLRREHSFNEYATSVTSAGSASVAAMGMSKPFDDYNTNLFQVNPDTGSSAGIGGAGVAGARATQPLTLEQRVNRRLAMPPWIYPTLLRVQEQLLGGYMRLRFLFQALNRSRNGHLTEAEFLPLMEFMNCLLEHPLSAEQAHLLFVCVHDSAIGYVQTMRNRRRQRSGSLYSEGLDIAPARRSAASTAAERAKSTSEMDTNANNNNNAESAAEAAGAAGGMGPSPLDGNAYARHRNLSEQVRGERYILLMEFIAFFGVKPVQHEDEVEGLEELLYEATGVGSSNNFNAAAAGTMNSNFVDVLRDGSTDGLESAGRPFDAAGLDLDGAAVSLSSVSATVSAGVPASAPVPSSLESSEKHPPAPIRVKGHSMEGTPSFRVGDTADVQARPMTADAGGSNSGGGGGGGGGIGGANNSASASWQRPRRRSSTVAVPFGLSSGVEVDASASLPRQPPSRLPSDALTITNGANNYNFSNSSFSGHRTRLSSWVAVDGGGVVIPTLMVNGLNGAAGVGSASGASSGKSPGSRRRMSSVAIGTGPNNSGSSSISGGPPAAQTSLRSGSIAASTALSIGDSTADHQLRASVLPTPIDVFTALASLGDTYGEDITLKELMQRLAQRQPRRSRVSLQPQEANPSSSHQHQHQHQHQHHLPMVLGASSLTSFASNLSEANGDGDDAANQRGRQKRTHRNKRNDAATAAAAAAAGGPAGLSEHQAQQLQLQQQFQQQLQQHLQHQQQQQQQQSPSQSQSQSQSQSRSRHNSPAAAQNLNGLISPTSSTPTPTTASLDVPGVHAPLPRTPDGAHYAGRLDGRNSPAADPEFSFASLQATLSQHGKISSRNTTITSPLPVPTPPPMHALPLGLGRGPSGPAHNQRSNSFLELSVVSISARPYMLNQAPEQRVTVLAAPAYSPQFAGPNVGASSSNLTSGSNSHSHSHSGHAGQQPGVSGKRSSEEGRRSTIGLAGMGMPGMPVMQQASQQAANGGPRYRQRVKGQRSAKHGTTVLVNAANPSWDNELVSMSLVPSMVLPPAPPTRQRVFHNSSSATLSEASHASSSASDNRGSGGANAQQQRKPQRQQKLSPSSSATTTAAVVQQQQQQQQQPQQPQHRITSASSNTSTSRRRGVAVAQQPSNGSVTSAAPPSPTRASPGRASSNRTQQQQQQQSNDKASAEKKKKPSVAEQRSPSEPSRAKAKLDNYIATAKAMQGNRSQSTSATTSPELRAQHASTGVFTASQVTSKNNSNTSNGSTHSNNNNNGGGNGPGVASGAKPSIPAPPPLQLSHGDGAGDFAAAGRPRPARPSPLTNNPRTFPHLGVADAEPGLMSPLFDGVGSLQTNYAPDMLEVLAVKGSSAGPHRSGSSHHPHAHQHGGGGSGGGSSHHHTTNNSSAMTNGSSSTVDFAAPYSCTSTAVPPTPSQMLSSTANASPLNGNCSTNNPPGSRTLTSLTTTTTTLPTSSTNTASTTGTPAPDFAPSSPLQEEATSRRNGRGDVAETHEAHDTPPHARAAPTATSKTTTARLSNSSSNGSSRRSVGSPLEKAVAVKTEDGKRTSGSEITATAVAAPTTATSTGHGPVRKKGSELNASTTAVPPLDVTARSEKSSAFDVSNSKDNESPLSVKSNLSVKSTHSGAGRRGKKSKTSLDLAAANATTPSTTSSAASPGEPPVPVTPLGDKTASSAAARGRGGRVGPSRRLPLKSTVTTADAMQRMYGTMGNNTSTNHSGSRGNNGGGSSSNDTSGNINGGVVGRGRASNNTSGVLSSGPLTRANNRGSVATANTARKATPSTSQGEPNQLASTARERPVPASARRPLSERRGSNERQSSNHNSNSNVQNNINAEEATAGGAGRGSHPPVLTPMTSASASPPLSESPELSEHSPTAKSARGDRGSKPGSKVRKNRHHAGPTRPRSEGLEEPPAFTRSTSKLQLGELSATSTSGPGPVTAAGSAPSHSASPLTLGKAHTVPGPLPGAAGVSGSTHHSNLDPLPAIEKRPSSGSTSGVSSPGSAHISRDAAAAAAAAAAPATTAANVDTNRSANSTLSAAAAAPAPPASGSSPSSGAHHFTRPKSPPLMPLPSPLPANVHVVQPYATSNNNSSMRDACSVMTTALPMPGHNGHSRTATGSSDGSAVSTASRRAVTHGMINLKGMEEDPHMGSTTSRSLLSPLHHKGPILSPLMPAMKRQTF